jgi:hypothetical protein
VRTEAEDSALLESSRPHPECISSLHEEYRYEIHCLFCCEALSFVTLNLPFKTVSQ